MSRLLIALLVAAGLSLAGPAAAQMYAPKAGATPMSKDTYTVAKKDADAQYAVDKDACSSLSGNAKDICVAEATGRRDVARGDAEAAFENTPKAREIARITVAEASYNVAVEKCDALAGAAKDACVGSAKVQFGKS